MRKVITVEPFGAKIVVARGETAMARELDVRGHTPGDLPRLAGAVYTFEDPDHPPVVIYLPEERNEQVLWHEALHLTNILLEGHKVEVSERNDEVMAYMQGYIVRLLDKAVYSGRRTNSKREVE